jgi:hypothetical protein
MIAAHGKIPATGVGIVAAFDFADPPPVEIARIPVLLVTRNDTALAADTFRHVEMETILLTSRRLAIGY